MLDITSRKSTGYLILVFFLVPLLLLSCKGIEYTSKRQGEGMKSLVAKNYPAAIKAFEKAELNASQQGDTRDVIHLKSLLGWTWSEAGYHARGEKILHEAVRLSDDNGMLFPLYRARLAVAASKSGNYQLGKEAGEKALDQEATRWKQAAAADSREAIIDYAISDHGGLPPDVDMIRTVIMAETALSVVYMVTGEDEKAKYYGESVVKHADTLSSIMTMAPDNEMKEFYQGVAVAAAAASRANLVLGNDKASAAYKQKGIEAFHQGGVEVENGNLLAAYINSTSKPQLEEDFRPYENDLSMQAEKLYREKKIRQARDVFRQAYLEAKKSGDHEKTANTAARLGWLLAELGKYPQALRLLKESTTLLPDNDIVSLRYAKLAALEARLGNYDKGDAYADKAIDVLLLHRKKMFQGKDRDKVIDAAMKDPGLPPDIVFMKAVAAEEGARTVIRYFSGNYQEAIRVGEKAAEHFQNIELAVSYGDYADQRAFYEGFAFTTLVTGDSFLRTGDVRNGKKYLSLARDYFNQAGLDYGNVIAEGLLGYAFVLEGNYAKGGAAFKKTMQRIDEGGYEELRWHIRSVMGSYLFNEAREVDAKIAELRDTNFTEAKKAAVAMAREKREKANALKVIFHNETGKNFLPMLDELEQARNKEELQTMGFRIARALKTISYDNYLDAINNVESIRSNLETDLNKRAYLANKDWIYSDFIELSTELYGAAKGLEALERFKAKSLVDLLASREITYRNGGLLKELANIQESFGEDALTAKKGGQAASYASSVQAAVQGYRSVIVRLKKKEPELASLVSAQPFAIKSLQRLLPKGLALVEYFITGEKTYIWVVRHDAVSVTVGKTGKATIQQQVRNFRKAILEKDSSMQSQSQALYSLLLKPVAAKLVTAKRLMIVPYDALHLLPFNALYNGKAYLIEDFPLASASSASVLKFALEKRSNRSENLFAVGNPDLGNPAYDLPFAEKEVRAISSAYPGARTYFRQQASEGRVKKESGRYGILHFASHAEFNAISPLGSSILLARDSANDGHLEAREVFSLDLHASLVTLSACQTGLGRITRGDEIIGMSRAFIYAGAPSILASLWSVSDESTAQLMEAFYRNLSNKKAKDSSLRNAQLGLIHSKRFRHPFYWAPFYLSGDWE